MKKASKNKNFRGIANTVKMLKLPAITQICKARFSVAANAASLTASANVG